MKRSCGLLMILFFGLSMGACDKLGKGSKNTSDEPSAPRYKPKTVTTAKDGSAEKIVFKAFEAAATADEYAGWQKFKKLLHSDQTYSQAPLKGWRRFGFKRFRKQYKNYLPKGSAKIEFTIMRVDERTKGYRKLFIKSTKTDMPTPIMLKKDAKAKNAWRIQTMSL